MKHILLTTMAIITCITGVKAQKWAIKTNAAYWATTTINLATEVALGQRTTLDIAGVYNPFTFDNNKKIKLWGIQPEFRLWTCERFSGHFFGIHAHYGQYNGGLKTYRYDGWLVGGGISYGYQWILGKRWNLETELGVGYAYMDHDRYLRQYCGKYIDHQNKHYFGPTKLSISFVYLLK